MIEETFTHTISDSDSEVFRQAADILKTVAHPVRLGIIDFLETGEKAVTQICTRLNAPQPCISQHLSLMKAKGILASRLPIRT